MRAKCIEVVIIVIFFALVSICFAGWDNTKPADSDAIYGWPASIRANWDALEAIYGIDLIGTPFANNVRTHGAIGDGITDDTDAFEAALAAASGISYTAGDAFNSSNVYAGGGTVYVPKGEYKITRTLYVNSFVTLRGEGSVNFWEFGNDENVSTLAFDFSGDLEKAAIDCVPFIKATGNRIDNDTFAVGGGGFDDGSRSFTVSPILENLNITCTTNTKFGIRLIGAIGFRMKNVCVNGAKHGVVTSSVWGGHSSELMIRATSVGLCALNNTQAALFDNTYIFIETGYAGNLDTDLVALGSDNHVDWMTGLYAIFNYQTAFNQLTIEGTNLDRAVFSQLSTAFSLSDCYIEGCDEVFFHSINNFFNIYSAYVNIGTADAFLLENNATGSIDGIRGTYNRFVRPPSTQSNYYKVFVRNSETLNSHSSYLYLDYLEETMSYENNTVFYENEIVMY